MKYKICKLVDGNGKEWYQVKKKGWFFWSYVKVLICPITALFDVITFDTFEKALIWVEKEKEYHITYKNHRKQKVVECVEV